MTHRLIHELQRSLDRDADVIDRTSITHWQMMFAAQKPLELFHTRIGNIRYEGVRFSGSPVHVFDQFVALTIEDAVEKHVRAVENELPDAPVMELAAIAEEAAGLILSFRAKLFNRAAHVKGAMLGDGFNPKPAPVLIAGIQPIPVREYLVQRARELKEDAPKATARPVWAWLEDFQKANPTLVRVISAVLIAAIGSGLTLLVQRLSSR
jgi:hypothetical protein